MNLVKIVWDERKRRKVLEERGFGGRLLAVGRLNGEAVTVVYALLGTEAISIVTMRPASRRERRLL